MSELNKCRSASSSALTKAYGDIGVLIAEDDHDAVVSEREHLKTMYRRFQRAHIEYHDTLLGESEIQASDAYFNDVQQLYASHQTTVKTALNRMQLQPNIKQEAHHEHSFSTLGHLINLPPLELTKFSGDPNEFDNFITTFKEVIGNVVSDPAVKLIRLKSQVTGAAFDSIKMCRTDSGDDGYTRAMKILYDRFGSPYIVCNSVIEQLKHGPDVRSPAEVRTFSDELANAEITLRNNKMFTEIDTQNNIVEICHRLDRSIRYEWRHKTVRNKQDTGVYLNFSEFVSFVQEQAEVVNDPLYGENALEDRPTSIKSKKTVSNLLVATEDADNYSRQSSSSPFNSVSTPNIQCLVCSKNHRLYSCYKFRNMPFSERCAYVNSNNLCTLCLSKDHLLSECRSSYLCKVNNCGKKHSSSLHAYAVNQTPSTAHCINSNDKSDVYMPTVPVVINGTFPTFALLDTGSSTTFCSRRLINQLKLQGANISFKLRTLNGSKNSCSEVVEFQMSSKDGIQCLYMNNVLVVDSIPVEYSSISDVSKYNHLKDLTFAHESNADILIGQDNSAALVPLEVRTGPVGAPFATRTLMGWSLNGCASESVPGHSVTSNFITTNLQDTSEHGYEDSSDIANRKDALTTSRTCHELDVSDNLYITFDRLVVLLWLLWFPFYYIMSLYLYICCSYGYVVRHTSLFEASHASMGGVLSLVYGVSHIVPYCVYTHTVSHPSTTMLSDYDDYTLYFCRNFVNIFLIYPYCLFLLSPHL